MPTGCLALLIGSANPRGIASGASTIELLWMLRAVTKVCLWSTVSLLAVVAASLAVLVWQGRRTPDGPPVYVALGSSFAAGAGLGPLQDGSPWICARSTNGYPQQLARMVRLSIDDMSCGGATAWHVIHGGQFFQGPQLRVVNAQTRLVTITVGGNDIGYISDLSMLAARNSNSAFGWLVRHFWGGPRAANDRDYPALQNNLIAAVRIIRKQSPNAIVVLATYPTILPPSGSCPRLALRSPEADLMREVASRLAASTRAAARKAGATLVDMQLLGAAHNACSAQPWTRGWTNGGFAPFHPTLQGANATAEAIASALSRSPAGVTAVREHDASGH